MEQHKRNDSGRLFVFEGPDDVGKSSLARMLRQHLCESGRPSELLSFPGSEPGTVGELVYRFYHNPGGFGVSSISPLAMQLIVTAAHVEVIESRIKPLITSGCDVVLDRYWWSTWVYATVQGVSESFRDRLIKIETLVWAKIRPNIIFLVLRNTPLLHQSFNDRWPETLNHYKQLFALQKDDQTIQVITNEGTVEEAFRTVIANIE